MHSIVASSALVPRVASSSTALTVFSSDVTLVTMTWERNKTKSDKSNEDTATKDVACGPMQPDDEPFLFSSVVWTLHRTLRVYCTKPQTGGAQHPCSHAHSPEHLRLKSYRWFARFLFTLSTKTTCEACCYPRKDSMTHRAAGDCEKEFTARGDNEQSAVKRKCGIFSWFILDKNISQFPVIQSIHFLAIYITETECSVLLMCAGFMMTGGRCSWLMALPGGGCLRCVHSICGIVQQFST